jgi:hypothetical protein
MVAIGFQALEDNNNIVNTAIGYNALKEATGAYCAVVGAYAFPAATTAGNCTGIGNYIGNAVTTGNRNVFMGQGAGYNVTTGEDNVCLGNHSGMDQITTQSGKLFIANSNTSNGNADTWIYGDDDGSCYQGDNSTSWSTTSDQRLKKDIVDNNVGLNIINQIRVRNFKFKQYNKTEVTGKYGKSVKYSTPVTSDDTIDLSDFSAGTTATQVVMGQGKTATQIGIIAQELETVLPNSVSTDDTTGAKHLACTDEIFWHMVNAIKELSAEVQALKAA